MNTYFIHTFELNYLLTFYEYDTLKRSLDRFYKDGSYICTSHTNDGITIFFRKCNKNEIKRKGPCYPFKLTLVVNPSRLIEPGTYVNKIFNPDDFMYAIDILDEKIKSIFSELIPEISGIDSFNLSRVDITKDILNVPENVIHEYIRIIRQLPLHYGYHINSQLEENCLSYNPDYSVNIVNDSNKTEFVLYNKHHATIDQGYPTEIQEYYKDVLRMELRCGRNFIKKETKDMEVSDALRYFYRNMHSVVPYIYDIIFTRGGSVCFLSYSWLKKMIKKSTGSKKKKREKMLNLAGSLHKNPNKDFDDILFRLFKSDKARTNITSYFTSICLSPIAISSPDILFMQSLDSLLEFKKLSKEEGFYFEFLRSKEKGKELFLHYSKK